MEADAAPATQPKAYVLTPSLDDEEADEEAVAGEAPGPAHAQQRQRRRRRRHAPADRSRCLNAEAIWSLTSARAGFGVDELLSEDVDSYWQSDGVTPHVVTIQFYRREAVAEVALYVDFSRDESYTPASFLVMSGALSSDLEEVRKVVLTEPAPKGWVRVPLGEPGGAGVGRFLRTSFLSLIVTGMYANGRDMHIRGIRVLGPPAGGRTGITAGGGGGSGGGGSGGGDGGAVGGLDGAVDAWATPAMGRYSSVR